MHTSSNSSLTTFTPSHRHHQQSSLSHKNSTPKATNPTIPSTSFLQAPPAYGTTVVLLAHNPAVGSVPLAYGIAVVEAAGIVVEAAAEAVASGISMGVLAGRTTAEVDVVGVSAEELVDAGAAAASGLIVTPTEAQRAVAACPAANHLLASSLHTSHLASCQLSEKHFRGKHTDLITSIARTHDTFRACSEVCRVCAQAGYVCWGAAVAAWAG